MKDDLATILAILGPKPTEIPAAALHKGRVARLAQRHVLSPRGIW